MGVTVPTMRLSLMLSNGAGYDRKRARVAVSLHFANPIELQRAT